MRVMAMSAATAAFVLAVAPCALAQSGGEATYKAKCQMCHGATGAGDTPAGKSMRVKSFKDPEIAKMSDAAMINITKNGQGKMPAYKDKLTDAQIKQVVVYIRSIMKK
jgi:cytochrome c6